MIIMNWRLCIHGDNLIINGKTQDDHGSAHV